MPDIDSLPGAHGSPNGSDNDDSDVTSVGSEDFESYFRNDYGRQFHSHGIYPLPVDDREVARAEDLHEALKQLIGSNFLGPVGTVLVPTAGVRRRALDLCTGSGLWVDDMADEFPHVRFYGIDLVPIMNRYPADNVQFEMGDVTSTLRWEARYFDLVHARFVTLGVPNYPRLLEEVGRVLKPGGLFISGEWRHDIFHPSGSVENVAPNAFRFFQLLRIATQRQGIPYNSLQIADFVRASGLFEEPHTEEFTLTFGNPLIHAPDDPRLQFRASVMGYGLALKYLFLSRQNQLPSQDATDLVNNFLRDIDNVPGLRMSYVVVYARRL